MPIPRDTDEVKLFIAMPIARDINISKAIHENAYGQGQSRKLHARFHSSLTQLSTFYNGLVRNPSISFQQLRGMEREESQARRHGNRERRSLHTI
jgi:hypothetical protein